MSMWTLPALLTIVVVITVAQRCGRPATFPGVNLIQRQRDAIPHSWPWHVSIQKETDGQYSHHCSGVLIGPKHVLTVYACFKGYYNWTGYKVLWGSVSPVSSDADGRMLEIRDDHWPNGQQFHSDLVVLELVLPEGVNTRFVQPVCPSMQQFNVGTPCVVTGFRNHGNCGDTAFVRIDSYSMFDPGNQGFGINEVGVVGGPNGVYYDRGGPLVCYNIDKRAFELQGINRRTKNGKGYFEQTTIADVYKWLKTFSPNF